MPVSVARVATDRASRYLAQLCRHFSHKAHAEWSEERGFTDFGWGRATLLAGPDALVIQAEAADEDALGRIEYVVGDHAERFGARDELKVSWTRS